MPEPIRVEQVSAVYAQAVRDNLHLGETITAVDFGIPEAQAETDTPPVDVPVDSETNGVAMTSRMIGGRKVVSLGHVTSSEDLQALSLLTERLGRGLGRPLRILEVGSWVGESAIALLSGAPKGSEVYCVDTWEGSPNDHTRSIAQAASADNKPWNVFVTNCGDLIGESIKPIKGQSTDVAAQFATSQNIDLIFIDAGHDYPDVLADLSAWYRHLSVDGFFCGHDYCPTFPGVEGALRVWLAERHADLDVVEISGQCVWMIENAELTRRQSAASSHANTGGSGAVPA